MFTSFATPWAVAGQAPLSLGFPRQEYQSGLPFPSPGDFPNPGIKARSPILQADTLPSEPSGKSSYSVSLGEIVIFYSPGWFFMRECLWVARVSFIFWGHEGSYWFGCLLSLSSACAGHYPLERRCAGAWPAQAPGRRGQQLVPDIGTLSSRSSLCRPLES